PRAGQRFPLRPARREWERESVRAWQRGSAALRRRRGCCLGALTLPRCHAPTLPLLPQPVRRAAEAAGAVVTVAHGLGDGFLDGGECQAGPAPGGLPGFLLPARR